MILVTGNDGFIGKRMMVELPNPKQGYDLLTGRDIRNAYQLEYTLETIQPDVVIHMAALPGVRRSHVYPQDYILTNITGTWNITKMCEKYEVKKLIFFSSSSVFGNAYMQVKETDDKKPTSLYGITKLAGEHIINQSTIPTTIIRPFTVYGENGRKDQVIERWLTQAINGRPITVYGNSDSDRGYTYVGDIVNAVINLINMEWSWEHEDFNLGGTEKINLNTLVELFKRTFPNLQLVYKERPKEDVMQTFADITKARRILGFDPQPCFVQRTQQMLEERLCL